MREYGSQWLFKSEREIVELNQYSFAMSQPSTSSALEEHRLSNDLRQAIDRLVIHIFTSLSSFQLKLLSQPLL